jgi:hypothetical protein
MVLPHPPPLLPSMGRRNEALLRLQLLLPPLLQLLPPPLAT